MLPMTGSGRLKELKKRLLKVIYVVSCGRSGSAWLSTLLVACGLRTTHEWFPVKCTAPQAVADTSWVWNVEQFISSLKPEDAIVVLDRSYDARCQSANRILGINEKWEELERQWDQMKAALKEVHNDVLWLKYEDLFQYSGRTALWHFLTLDISQERFFDIWDFLRNMRITNKTAEEEVIEARGKK